MRTVENLTGLCKCEFCCCVHSEFLFLSPSQRPHSVPGIVFFTPSPRFRLMVFSPWRPLLWAPELSSSLLVPALTVALILSKVANVSHCCSEKWESCRERCYLSAEQHCEMGLPSWRDPTNCFPWGAGLCEGLFYFCWKGVKCIEACVPALCADSTCLKQPGSQGLPAWGPSIIHHFCCNSWPPLWAMWFAKLRPWSEPGQAKKGKVTRGFLMASLFIPEPSYCHGYNFLLPTSDTAAEWLLEWLVMKWSEAIWEQFWTLLLWTSIYCFNGQVALQVHSHVCGMLFIIHPQKRVSITVVPSSWFWLWSSPLSELIEPCCLETQWQQLFFICLKESCTFLLASC